MRRTFSGKSMAPATCGSSGQSEFDRRWGSLEADDSLTSLGLKQDDTLTSFLRYQSPPKPCPAFFENDPHWAAVRQPSPVLVRLSCYYYLFEPANDAQPRNDD